MNRVRSLPWVLISALGSLALIRPLVRIVGSQRDLETSPMITLGLTAVIAAVWVAVVGFSKITEPVLTLLFAGVTYGVLAIVVSAILSPILDEELAGPLANPIAIAPLLAFNAAWGLAAGGLALLVQRARGVR